MMRASMTPDPANTGATDDQPFDIKVDASSLEEALEEGDELQDFEVVAGSEDREEEGTVTLQGTDADGMGETSSEAEIVQE